MFFIQSMLQGMGFQSQIFVEHLAAELKSRILPLEDLLPSPSDLLLIHHSMGHDALPHLVDLPCRKFLIYHNITPPEFFSVNDPVYDYVVKGYSQLSLLREVVESAIGISPINARQLIQRNFEHVSVIPLLKDFCAIRHAPHSRAPYHDDSPTIRLLFVGRAVPHKCQHELIDFIGKIRSIGPVPLRLTLVGDFENSDRYTAYLHELIRSAGLDQAVEITGRVTDRELFGWYRAASAYISLSEHEGFGVPLVEAMAFDLPVIAYASAAVPDTLGGAGITISDKASTTILEQLLSLQENSAFRAEIIKSQRRRLLSFSRACIEAQLRDWLVEAGALDSATKFAGFDGELEPHSPRPQRTHYVIEGPFETSYSLAIVNRNLALALSDRDACAACIEPAEGTGSYSIDPIAASRLPAKVQNLVHPGPLDAERIVTIRNTYPPRPNGILGDLRFLHLAWEESSVSSSLAGLINLHLDGVLVPSEYSKRAIRNSGARVPIEVIGHGIDHNGVLPQVPNRAGRGQVTPALPYTFLHISSGLARKGIEELMTAYCLAFSSDDAVLLVIKTFDNESNTIDGWLQHPTSASKYSPAIQVISEELNRHQMQFLYNIADAVVLPTRGEGFNLPAAEAMALGLPLIVTRHSGHMDFCNDENSFLIDCTYELSSSHLNVPNSFWARASVEQLVHVMKKMYHAGRSPNQITASRIAQAQRDAAGLRWRDVAARVDRFVEYLGKRPIMRRKLRLAWISTYNARCGIATHSQHLLEFFDRARFEITIIADDQETIGTDPDNVQRLWKRGGPGLDRVLDYVVTNKFDAIVLQYNLSFFEVSDLADMLLAFGDANLDTFVILHRTKGLEEHRWVSNPRIKQAFQSCTRVFVHNIEDVNRLREGGLTENVILLAHGVIDQPTLSAEAVRVLLGLSTCSPIIGTFGFLLPDKGLPELIQSFALLLRAHPAAYLLMLNAGYPSAESEQERERCLALLRQLEIEHQTRLINDFLDIQEILFLLSACEAIVFPYQRSDESASGAVKLGLAVGRPVLTTPLSVFSDLSEIVYQLPGTGAQDIASGIISFLRDESLKAQVLKHQRDWVKANSWATQADRLANIIQGCFEERRGIELLPVRESAAAVTVPSDAGAQIGPSSIRAPAASLATIQQFFNDGPKRRRDHPIASGGSAEIAATSFSGTNLPRDRVGRVPGLLQRVGLTRRGVYTNRGEMNFISRADRARDSRDWAAAAEFYREALDESPDKPAIWVQYGHALKESGSLAQAESAYRRALDLDAGTADTYLQLGHALKIQGKKIEACAAYFRALLLDPALEDASFELRGLGWTRGRIRLALQREQRSSP